MGARAQSPAVERRRYFSVRTILRQASSEAAQLLLHESGALGLEIRDDEVAPMPGAARPAKGEAMVIGFFADRRSAQTAHALVATRISGAKVQLAESAVEDWSELWKSRVRSVVVGRLWVGPPWLAHSAPRDKSAVVIEPKMAFGTGDHPTTRLCLEALDAHLAAHPGDSVLDVGTGTGVLAIAARKLGAGRVAGIDTDPIAVAHARENAVLNGVPDLELATGSLESVQGKFGLVLANILANTLIEMAPLLKRKVQTRLVLAGILKSQRKSVEGAFREVGLLQRGRELDAEWVRLDLEPS